MITILPSGLPESLSVVPVNLDCTFQFEFGSDPEARSVAVPVFRVDDNPGRTPNGICVG